jgi:hypothetical protein
MAKAKRPMPTWLLFVFVIAMITVVEFIMWLVSKTFGTNLPQVITVMCYICCGCGAIMLGFIASNKICTTYYSGRYSHIERGLQRERARQH